GSRLRRRVWAGRVPCALLIKRTGVDGSVDFVSGNMHHLVDLPLLSCSKEIEGAPCVALKERLRVGYASVDVGLRCEVHQYVRILQNFAGKGVVGNVSFYKSVTWVSPEFSNIGRVAS